jgi:uncharacterized protein YdhG (YjbR/CyaY superfamily)
MKSSRKSASDVDRYLATVPKDARAALARLRKIIRAAAPKATETISYQMPAYKYHGLLVAFAAFKDHCSFFPGAAGMKALQHELKAYDTSKGTIRFPIDKPLPAVLVKKLVKARIKENEARRAAKKH